MAVNHCEKFEWDKLPQVLTSDFKKSFEEMIISWESEKQRNFLLDALRQVSEAVSLEDAFLWNLCWILNVFLRDLEPIFRDVCQSNENPLKGTNHVILATWYKMYSLLFFPTKVDRALLLALKKGEVARPDDVDQQNHTAFYYALKSDDVSYIKIISEELWSEMTTSKLEDLLSLAFSELKLKNVTLKPEIEAYVIEKLVNLRFFSVIQIPTDRSNPVEKIVQRVYFLLNAIKRLREYIEICDEDTDMELIAAGEYVAKSLHVLKYQLKSTYDRIPWEEIEFCLIYFLKKYKKPLDTHMFFSLVLTTNKMSEYLVLFSEVLESRIKHVQESNVRDLAKYPRKERSAIVTVIQSQHELFKTLYIDYERVRDFHSLEMIKSQADLVSEVSWDSGGLNVVTRALQVIGENLKNTNETPKLSTSEYLLQHFQEESRKILEKLRDSLSKDKFLMLREQIASYGEPFFRMLKEDICELNIKITSCLLLSKEKLCNQLVSEILQCNNPEEIRNFFKRINIRLGLIAKEEKEEKSTTEIIEKNLNHQLEFVNELRSYGGETADEALDIITLKLKLTIYGITERLKIYYSQWTCIYKIAYEIENKLRNDIYIKQYQEKLRLHQKNLSELVGDYLPYREVMSSGLMLFIKGLLPHFSEQKIDKITNQNTILYKMNMNYNRVRWIKELKSTLDANKKSKGLEDSDLEALQASKHNALQKLFDENNLFKTPEPYENDPKLRAQVDMLVLDLMSLLSDSHFSHNLFFLDHLVPVAIGKNLRNHLAHGNVLYDVLLARQSVQILSSASKILEIAAPPLNKIDQVLPCDVLKLRENFEREMRVVDTQMKLFRAARSGDIESISSALSEGADVDGKNTSWRTSLHLAASGGHLEACRFLYNCGANPLSKDIEGRTPLHLAAGSGAREVIMYFITKCHVDVDIRDRVRRSPLFVAAEKGQTGAIEDLLELGAKADLRSETNNLASHVAALNGQVETVRVLVNYNSDLILAEEAGGKTLLHVMAENGSVEMLCLLQNKPEVSLDARDDLCMTPLSCAASFGNCEAIRYLVEIGADINATSITGLTPLVTAADSQQCEAVEILLELGANPNLTSDIRLRDCGYPKIEDYILDDSILDKSIPASMKFPLTEAAANGCVRCASALLEKGGGIDATNRDGKSALHYAVSMEEEEMVRFLVDRGASTNIQDYEGKTPLHYAAFLGFEGIFKILLEAPDIEVMALDFQNHSPLDHAIANEQTEIAIVLMFAGGVTDDTTQFTAFFEMATYFIVSDEIQEKLVPYIKGTKRKFNIKNICSLLDRDYAVHYAVIRGNAQFLKFCIQNNFDVNGRDDNGNSPLHHAAQLGNSEMANILLENGASVDQKDGSQKTALDVAVINSNPECAELLIGKGSTIRFETLYLAVRHDSEVLKTLLKEGFDVNTREGGRTLLHEAAEEGSIKAAETLLEAGADIEMETRTNHERALHLAAYHGHRDVVVMLLSKKADPNPLTLDRSTPLHLAISGEHVSVILALLQGGADLRIKHPVKGKVFEQAVRVNNLPALKILRDHIGETEGDPEISSIVDSEDFLLFEKYFSSQYSIKNKKTMKCPSKNISTAVEALVDHSEHLAEYLPKMKNNLKRRVMLEYHISPPHPERVSREEDGLLGKCLRRKSKRNLRTKKLSRKKNSQEVLKFTRAFVEENPDSPGDDKQTSSSKHTPTIQLPSTSDERINNRFEQNDHAKHAFPDFDGFKSDVHGFLLHISAERGFLEMVRYFVTEGMNVMELNSDGLQPLHLACRNGHSDVVSFLLNEIKSSRTIIPEGLLHLAAEGGHCDVLELLLNVGVSINDVDCNGDTAVHLAARGGHELALRKLLSHGAFFDVKNKTFKTPLEEANSEAALVLRPTHRLFNAVKNDNIHFIERNIEEGAFVNARSCSNKTPLILASEKGSSEAIDLLLSRGADPNLSGPKGNVPLHYASCRTDGEPIVRSLLQHDAIYEAWSEDGKTPLDVAKNPSDCLLKTVDHIFRWLKRGKGFENRVLLCLLGIKDFQDRKAIVRARDRNGNTLMAVATRNGFEKIDALKLAVSEYFIMVDILKVALFLSVDYKSILNASKTLLKKMKKLLCPDDPIVQEIHLVISISHIMLGKWPMEVLSMVNGMFGSCQDSLDSCDCLDMEDCINSALKNFIDDPSKELPNDLRTTHDTSKREPRLKHERNALFLKRLGKAYENSERLDLLSSNTPQFQNAFQDIHGDELETLLSLHLVDESFSSNDDWNKARLGLEKLLKNQKERFGVQHPFTSIIQYRLGMALLNLGNGIGSLLVLKEVVNRGSKNDPLVKKALTTIEEIKRFYKHTISIPSSFLEDVDDLFPNNDHYLNQLISNLLV